MNYCLMIIMQLFYIIPSLILYFLMFLFLCWSDEPEFQSAFHRLFIARAPADTIQVMISLIAFRFPIAGWQGCMNFAQLAKIGFVVSQYSMLLELSSQFLLSVNRFSAIAMPLSHNKIWTKKSTYLLLISCALLSLIPTVIRIPQPASYLEKNGMFIPILLKSEDQRQNSFVSCCIYISFCIICLICNISAICLHSKQRKMQNCDTQPKLAAKVQTNLLIYSCIFTIVVIAMTICQCILALSIFNVSSDAHNLTIVFMTIFADAMALSNPWLLFCLSGTFRRKFLEVKNISKIFSSSSTGGEII